MSRTAPTLYERAEVVDLLGSALAPGPSGRVVLVEGVPGIGKSALLAESRRMAADTRIFAARGHEQETAFPFGIVRQLFDPALHDGLELEGAARLASAALGAEVATVRDLMPVFHGLYWLTSALAETTGVALMVDDAQWADEPSLGFLAYLARRVDDLPVTIIVASRPVGSSSPPALRDLALEPGVDHMALAPLSLDAVAAVLAEDLGEPGTPVDAAFVAACHAATGGNPFLLHALADEIRDQGLPATAATADQVGSLAPTGASRAIAARLLRLDDGQRRLIEAVAVLGDGARLMDVAALIEMPELDAAALAVALREAALLTVDGDALACAHAIVRTSVLSNIDNLIAVSWHRSAADVLRRHGRAPAEVAVHLLALPTLRDDDIATLVQAAADARSLGSPAIAASLLMRVVDTTEAGPDRGPALLLLGRAEAAAGLPDAERHLRAAAQSLPEGPDRWVANWVLARACKFRGAATEAVGLLDEALAAAVAAAHPLAADLEQELVALAYSSVSARVAVIHRLEPPDPSALDGAALTPREGFMSAAWAFEAALRGDDHQLSVALALHAATQTPLPTNATSAAGFGTLMAANALLWCDRFDDAERLFDAVADASRAAGGSTALSTALALRALLRWRSGKLAEGEADAAEAIALADGHAVPPPLLAAAIAAGVLIALERADDELSAATQLLAVEVDPDGTPYGLVRHARGRLLIASGQLERGLRELLAAGDFEDQWGAHNPAVLPWRSDAARALALLGQVDRANELAAEELGRARAFGAKRAVGVALAGAGAMASGEDRVRLLQEAVDVLAGSGARLEHARALVELGNAQRLVRQTEAALDSLRSGLDRASAIGAFRLARAATTSLRSCGARPRRHSVTGIDALTPSERRVVELASAGATNRGIAQQLFVSEKTVETHLSHAYDKLGVRERRRLGELLATSIG